MKKLGILGAMDCEIALLCETLSDCQTQTVNGLTFYTGKLGNFDVILCKTGEGKVNAAYSATTMICQFAPDAVINIGCMGGLHPDLKTLDVVVASSLCEHDLEYGVRGWPRGTVFLPDGGTTVMFSADPAISSGLLTAAQNFGVAARVGIIASGDLFVSNDEDRNRIRDTFRADGCEMEGAAVAHVCTLAKVPFGIVRSVSDGANSKSSMSFEEFAQKAGEISAAILIEFSKLF